MSYMGSIAMLGKSIVGSPTNTIMPPEPVFQAFVEESRYYGLVHIGEQPLGVSSVYSADPDIMGRKL